MQPDEVAEVMADPIAQELLQSAIPARLAYMARDGSPRAIPIAFHWNGLKIVLGTVPKSAKVRALQVMELAEQGTTTRHPLHRRCHSAGLASLSWTSF